MLPPLSSSCPRRPWVLAVFLSTCLWKEKLSSGVPGPSASCTGLFCLWHSSCRSPLTSHPQGVGWCPHDNDSWVCSPDTSQAASVHVCSGHTEPHGVGSLGWHARQQCAVSPAPSHWGLSEQTLTWVTPSPPRNRQMWQLSWMWPASPVPHLIRDSQSVPGPWETSSKPTPLSPRGSPSKAGTSEIPVFVRFPSTDSAGWGHGTRCLGDQSARRSHVGAGGTRWVDSAEERSGWVPRGQPFPCPHLSSCHQKKGMWTRGLDLLP